MNSSTYTSLNRLRFKHVNFYSYSIEGKCLNSMRYIPMHIGNELI